MKIKLYKTWATIAICLLFFKADAMTIRADAAPQIGLDSILANTDFTVDVYMNNDDSLEIENGYRVAYSTPFAFFSTDNSIQNITHIDVGGEGPTNNITLLNGFDEFWDIYFEILGWSYDGNLPDSISITGIGLNAGWPFNLGEQLYIQFSFRINDTGTFCIDSIDGRTETYDWLFEPPSPDFNGPYCWTLICIDSDGDGFCDVYDNCPEIYNPDQENSDSDSLGNACDNCPDIYNPEQVDSDEDSIGNSCDNCPEIYNPNQENFDADNWGDSCDNCPGVYNPGQADGDQDGIGDSCDSEIQVINYFDSGPGSFYWAISLANSRIGTDTIIFLDSDTIQIIDPLPALTDDSTIIQGSSAPGGAHTVIINGPARSPGSGLVINSSSNYIEGLTITGFSGNGIEIIGATSTGNTITNNIIYGNGLLGIDLSDDGVTANDSGDTDNGPNDLLNFPEFDSVVYLDIDSSFTTYGTAANSAVIEFFEAHPAGDSTRPADPSEHGEAYSYIGSATCDEDGDFNYTFPHTVKQLSIITATATDTLGNTSEFCQNDTIDPGPLTIVGYTTGRANVISLWVTDPEGYYIGRDADDVLSQTLFPATYTEAANDSIKIPYPKSGTYIASVITETGAAKRTTYAVGVRIDGSEESMTVIDRGLPPEGDSDEYNYEVEENWHYINGDANRDETVNIFDITFIISNLYLEGPAPWPVNAADANCDLVVNIFDITYLITYLYLGGEEPCYLQE